MEFDRPWLDSRLPVVFGLCDVIINLEVLYPSLIVNTAVVTDGKLFTCFHY